MQLIEGAWHVRDGACWELKLGRRPSTLLAAWMYSCSLFHFHRVTQGLSQVLGTYLPFLAVPGHPTPFTPHRCMTCSGTLGAGPWPILGALCVLFRPGLEKGLSKNV